MAIAGYKHMTQAGAGLKDGSDWDNAFDEPAFEAWIEGVPVGSYVVWVKDGVYTLDSDIDFNAYDGSGVSPIKLVGVKEGTTNENADVTYDDWARDPADKPFFDCDSFEFRTGDYTQIINFDMQGADTRVLYTGSYCLVENCKLDSDGLNNTALATSNYSAAVNNEVLGATANYGIYVGFGSIAIYNYIHDIIQANFGAAILFANDSCFAEFNIMDNCVYGIYSNNRDGCVAVNNTIYDCNDGIRGNTCNSWNVINNILSDCTNNGVTWIVQTDSNYYWKNHFHNNGADWNNVDIALCFQDYERTAGNPLFTNPGVDMSLQNGSPCIGEGMSIELGVG